MISVVTWFLILACGFDLQPGVHHGNAHPEKGSATCPSQGTFGTAPLQNWIQEPLRSADQYSTAHSGRASLKGSISHCTLSLPDEHINAILAVFNMHEGVWQNTPVLWHMWKIMAPLCGSNFWSPQSSTSSPMVLHCWMGTRSYMGRPSLEPARLSVMVQVSQTAPITTQKDDTQRWQKGRLRCSPASQGQRQASACGAVNWSTSSSQPLACRNPVAYSVDSSAAYSHGKCSKFSGGEAAQDVDGSAQKAQRNTSSGGASNGQRCRHQRWAERNQADAFCGSGSWASQTGPSTGPTCPFPPPRSMAWISHASCGPVEGLQRPICRTRETIDRTSPESCRGTSSSQGNPCVYQDSCRGGKSGGCNERGGQREDQGGHQQCRRQDQGGHHELAHELGSPSFFRRPDAGRRTEGIKKAAFGSRSWGLLHCLTVGWIRFWLGRVNMDDPSIAHWPMDPTMPQDTLLMKWNHSVLHLDDFMSEWAAHERAFHLAFEVNVGRTGFSRPECSPNHGTMKKMQILNEDSSFDSAVLHPSQRSHKAVCFNPNVTAIFDFSGKVIEFQVPTVPGLSSVVQMATDMLSLRSSKPCHALAVHPTPTLSCRSMSAVPVLKHPSKFWSQCIPFSNSRRDFESPITQHVRVDELTAELQVAAPAHSPADALGPQSRNIAPAYAFVNSPKVHELPANDGTARAVPQFVNWPHCKFRASSDGAHDQISFYTSAFLPQFEQSGKPERGSSVSIPINTARRDYESPIANFHNHNNDANENQDPPHDPPGLGPADALFLGDLVDGFHEVGIEALAEDFTAPVRSWFLDHATIRQWFAPRIFQLHGSPLTWEDQIVAVWRDQLDDNEWFDVSVIRPQPPRQPHQAAVQLDIVISQSIHFPRHAGLVTVIPIRNMQFAMYSVAISFNMQVSGDDIIHMADARPMCRHRACTITNRWQEIPVNNRPVHVMSPGDSFQVMVPANTDAAPSQKKRRQSYRQESQSSSATGVLDVPMSSDDPAFGTSHAASSSSTAAPFPVEMDCECDSLHDDDLHEPQTILHVFQLDGPTHVISLHHSHGIHPTHVLAQAIGVPLTQLEILHQVPIRPMDIPRGQTAVIAHRSGDIDFNQNHRLILIDINYHHHPTTAGHMTQPTRVRLVQAAPEHILRDGLLLTAAVLHYCQIPPHECLLQLDGHMWPVDDLAPRRLYHGSYAIVDVSPPQSRELDTQRAAQELHRDSLRPEEEVFRELFVMSPEDDATGLLQAIPMSVLPDLVSQSAVEVDQDPVHQATPHAQESNHVAIAIPCPERTTLVEPISGCSKIDPQPVSALDFDSAKASPVDAPAAQREVPLSFQAVSNPLPAGQLKISNFFKARSKLPQKPKADRGSTQLPLERFFTPKKLHSIKVSDMPPSSPTPVCTDPSPVQATTVAKCNEAHVVDAPRFEAPIPPLLIPVLPPEQGHHLWRLDLQRHFEDLATIEHRTEGPILYVQVWFVHHGNFRTCPAPRIVRIEDDPAHWYESLIEPWREHIQFQTPVKVEIVTPPPAYTFHEHAPVHIILEQQGTADVAAIIFTAAFHGGHRMGLFQVAESVPSRICTRLLIQHHQFQMFCDFRPCRMYSGRFRFEMDFPEEVPTGISVLLDVGSVSAPSASSTDPVPQSVGQDEFMLMQMPPTANLGSPQVSRPRYKAAPKSLTRQGPPRSLDPISEREVRTLSLTVPNMQEFQATLHWTIRQHLTQHPHTVVDKLQIATWYIDADRLPRSDHSRVVVLAQQQDQWLQAIAQRWHDFIDSDQPLEFHMVYPSLPGGDPAQVGQVILRQQTPDTKRAALISVTDWNDDPWHPMAVCTFLTSLTSYEELIHEAIVDTDCPPVKPEAQCIVQHGTVAITPGTQFPVRHGYSFDVAAAIDDECHPHTMADSLAFIQLSIQQIRVTIHQLQVKVAGQALAPWTSELGPRLLHLPDEPPMHMLPRDERLHASNTDLQSLQPKWDSSARALASTHERAATAVVWFLDHVRHPQCFQPRTVMLFQEIQEWETLILHAWRDVLLPNQPVQIHVVFPDPEEEDPLVIAHFLVTQQALEGFRSVLISTYDSQLPGAVRMHASMAPNPLQCHTLYALAYLARDCNDQQNTCVAWHGTQEVMPHQPFPIEHGMALIVAIHRHVYPQPDAPDPWEAKAPKLGHPPVQLSLQACIPDAQRSCQIDDALPQLLWFESDAWLHEIAHAPPIQLHPLPDGLHIPPVSYWELVKNTTSEAPPSEVPTLTLYVDGSAKGPHAAWGLIVTCGVGPSETFLGCSYGQVQLAPAHPHWIGAVTTDNIAAELTAMVIAQSTALRWPITADLTIRPDLSLSRMLAQAVSICRSNQPLAQLCKVLGLWTAKQIKIEEVRGHTKHPWNEVVDVLAKWATFNEPAISDVDIAPLHKIAQCPHDIGWAWMQTTHPSMAACFPPVVDQQVMQFVPSNVQLSIMPTERQAAIDPHIPMAQIKIKLQTANVLATEVWSKHTGTKRTGQRTTRLDAQWHQAGIHAIGVQEARTPTGCFQSNHYNIYASGAKTARAPLYGCELWLHRTLHIGTDPAGKPITFGQAQVTVQHADPRRLFVNAQLGTQSMQFIVLHTPCLPTQVEGQPPPMTQLQVWWDETSALLHKFPAPNLQWILIDANSPLDADCDDLVGPMGAEASSKQGQLFKAFLQEHRLAVPCTFPALHSGQTTTWTHSTGKKSRKDYVLIPLRSLPLAVASKVVVDHDTSFAHEDHLPVYLEVQGCFPPVQSKVPIRWDEEALLDPAKCDKFRQALHTLPLPAWHIHVDDHAAIFEKQVLHLAQQHFAAGRTKRRPIHLRNHTQEAIAFKRNVLDAGRRLGLFGHEPFRQELRDLEKSVAQQVREDIQAHYDALIAQLEDAGEMANHRLLYRLLQRLGRRKKAAPVGPRPLPTLRSPDGGTAQTYHDQQIIWRDQFSAIEAAVEVTWETLQSANAFPPPLFDPDLDPSAFPSSWDIQMLMAKLKRDKVAGPNLIPPAVMKAGGEILSRQLAALFAKAVAQAKEPLTWKGGTLIPLWKGKASPSLPDAYRSIFISNYSAKLFHQCVRQHLVDAWTPDITAMQYGGRAGLGVDMAHHVVQSHQAWATGRGIPTAVLFVDIRSAFYTVIRQSFTALPNDNAAFLNAMAGLGMMPEDLNRLLQVTSQDAVAHRLSLHLQHLLRDLMSQTFFTLPGLEMPCQTTRGTRPGDPIADILFNMCMTAILAEVHTNIQLNDPVCWLGAATPVTDLSQPGPMPAEAYADVTFVDDIAVLMHARTNDRLIAMTQCIVEALASATDRMGLTINFDRGKTELLWTLAGKGTKGIKTAVHLAGNALRWQSQDQRPYVLHTCHAYKHLGTWVQTKHRHAREVAKRASSAKQQFGQLSRSFFTRKISLDVRAKVFQSLVVSKLIYNVHTWAGHSAKEFEDWNNAARPMAAVLLRGTLDMRTKFQHTTDDLVAACGLLPLPDQVHAQRLRFLKRLIQACPRITWTLLHAMQGPDTWIELCMTSIAWLCLHHGGPLPAGPQDSFLTWVAAVSLDNRWKGKIRQATNRARAFHSARAKYTIWTQHFAQRLARHGATLPASPTSASNVNLWQCDLCPKTFGSARALSMHAARVHNYRKKVRYFAIGEDCHHCLQRFHTRCRLATHYEKNERCYQVIQACWPPMPQALVDELDQEAKEREVELRKDGWWATKALEPALRLTGPALPPADSQAARDMQHKMHARRPPDNLAFENLQGRCITHKEASDKDSDKTLWWQTSDLPAFVFQSMQGADRGGGAYDMYGLAKEAATLHVRALVIVHFFSGYRRVGDLHDIIDHRVQETGEHIFAISVDLCMQRQSADLAKPGALRWWHQRAASGQLVSAGGGPPCETYTAARMHTLPDGTGPRPLRSGRHPTGLPALRAKEWAQVWIGDALLRFLLDMLSILAALGMSGFLEHPQYPTWCGHMDPPSIWALDAIRLLKGLRCCSIVSFDQCVCGAVAKKPTTLLLIRLPSVRHALLQRGRFGRCDHAAKTHEILIGKQANGTYQTSKAKVYPAGLNLVLGQAMFSFAASFTHPEVNSQLPEEFHPFLQQRFEDIEVVQPDFHGR